MSTTRLRLGSAGRTGLGCVGFPFPRRLMPCATPTLVVGLLPASSGQPKQASGHSPPWWRHPPNTHGSTALFLLAACSAPGCCVTGAGPGRGEPARQAGGQARAAGGVGGAEGGGARRRRGRAGRAPGGRWSLVHPRPGCAGPGRPPARAPRPSPPCPARARPASRPPGGPHPCPFLASTPR